MLIEFAGVRIDVRGDLGLQRGRQHLPRAITHDPIEQRPTDPTDTAGRVGLSDFLTTLSTGVPSRTSAPTPVLIRANGLEIILGKVRPSASPRREPSTGSDHCSKIVSFPLNFEEPTYLSSGWIRSF